MMSPACPCSVARARASCGFWCAIFRRSCTMTRLSARSSLSSAVVARRCIFSIAASRARPSASRAITTASASEATKANASPRMPRLSLRANRSSISAVTPSPAPSSTSPPIAAQNTAPQRKPRRVGSIGVSTGTGSNAASASGVTWTVPRDGRLSSFGSITMTPGSSSLKVAGRRERSLIAVCLRAGIGGCGRGGCEAKRVRFRLRAPAPAGESEESGSRPCQVLRWSARQTRRRS